LPLLPSVKLSVIGCGNWGQNYARELSELGCLHSIVSRSPEKSKRLAEKFNTKIQSLDECLASDVNGVVVSTPPSTLCGLALQAIAHQKHVLLEKPGCVSAAELAELENVASRSDGVIMIGFLLRFHAGYEELLKRVNGGAIGQVIAVKSTRTYTRSPQTDVDISLNYASHSLSIIIPLLGAELIGESTVISKINSYDLAATTPGGVSVSVSISVNAEENQRLLYVRGQNGALVLDERLNTLHEISEQTMQKSKIRGLGKNQLFKKRHVKDSSSPLRRQCVHFMDCIENCEDPRTGVGVLSDVISPLLKASGNRS